MDAFAAIGRDRPAARAAVLLFVRYCEALPFLQVLPVLVAVAVKEHLPLQPVWEVGVVGDLETTHGVGTFERYLPVLAQGQVQSVVPDAAAPATATAPRRPTRSKAVPP